jgi:hypothetical protein
VAFFYSPPSIQPIVKAKNIPATNPTISKIASNWTPVIKLFSAHHAQTLCYVYGPIPSVFAAGYHRYPKMRLPFEEITSTEQVCAVGWTGRQMSKDYRRVCTSGA